MSYERTDASIRLIVISAAIVLFGVLGSLVAAAALYRGRYDEHVTATGMKRQTSFTGGPFVQTSIARDWADASTASKRLTEYAWVDREAGIARIPIERAMEWIATHGVDGAMNTAPASRIKIEEPPP